MFFEELDCTGIDLHKQHKWGTSSIIYEFICQNLDAERATFKNCFDIPFHLIIMDDDTQNEVLGYELVDENEVLDEEE